MGLFQACLLGLLVFLHAGERAETAAGPKTASLTTGSMDSSTWGEAVAVQPTRIEEPLVNPEGDYASLQYLLTKNIPGTSEEKRRLVDLLLQLLSEIDLPTLCDVIANDTSRRADGASSNDKMPGSSSETVEIAFPTADTKPRYGVTAPFAIPYFNILGQSKNTDTEKEPESLSTPDRGMTPDSIVGYHRNMVERVNRGMNAMREYGNKRADFMRSLRRSNNNARQSQFSAGAVPERMPEVDEMNELRNLHADDVIAQPPHFTRESASDPNLKEGNDSVPRDVSAEADSVETSSKSSDESLASSAVWIRSMNVVRPKSDLYSRSLLIGDVTDSDNLIRVKRIGEGDETLRSDSNENKADDNGNKADDNGNKADDNGNKADNNGNKANDNGNKADDNDNNAIEDNMVVRMSKKGDTILPGSIEFPSASTGNEVYSENAGIFGGGESIIFDAVGADYSNTIFNDDKQATANIEHNGQGSIGLYNILNQVVDYEAEKIVNAADNVDVTANTTSGVSSGSIYQSHNEAGNVDSSDSRQSDSRQNTTFESLFLNQGPDASIDDFFGEDAVVGRLVHLPEHVDTQRDQSTASIPSSSQEVSVAGKKVTFSGGDYLIDDLFNVPGANITTAHVGDRSMEQGAAVESTNVLSDVLEPVNISHSGSHGGSSVGLTSEVTGNSTDLSNISHVNGSVSTETTEMGYDQRENSSRSMNSTQDSSVTYSSQAVRNTSELDVYIDSNSTNEATNAKSDKREEIGTTQSFIVETQEENKTVKNVNDNDSLYKTSEILALISKYNTTIESSTNLTTEPIEALNQMKVIEQVYLNNTPINDNIDILTILNVSMSNSSQLPQNESAIESTSLHPENANSSSLPATALAQVLRNDTDSTTSVEVQESHHSRGSISLDKFIRMNISEPYIRYEPSSTLERTEPSLEMFGPYGASVNGSVPKHDVIVADVVRASPSEMSIESARAELEMELKRLGKGESSSKGRDLISIMRGNQRGSQRGVFSTSYSSFLSQPVMKSLKRIHEEFRRRGDPQSTTADVTISDDARLLKNSNSTGSGNRITVSAAPSYAIADATFADLRSNATTSFTTKTNTGEIESPVKTVVQSIDGLIDILNQSTHRQSQVKKEETSFDEHKSEDNNGAIVATFARYFDHNKTEENETIWTNATELLKDVEDKQINVSTPRLENDVDRTIVYSNFTGLIGQSSSRDVLTAVETHLDQSDDITAQTSNNTVTKHIIDVSRTAQNRSENTPSIPTQSVYLTQQDEQSVNFTRTSIPDAVNSTISSRYEFNSTSYFDNQTSALLSSEELSLNNSEDSSLDNSTSETAAMNIDDFSNVTNATFNIETSFVEDAANISVADEIVADDDNSTNTDMASNETQANGDILDYFMPTTFSEDDYSNIVAEDGVLSNDPEEDNEETRAEDDDVLKRYESQFRAYLKSKRPFKSMTSFEDYQNELMATSRRRNPWARHGRNHMLYHPKVKFAVKPEASPFLADDFYKVSKRNDKHRQVARVNPWKAFNIELGKEKVKQQKEAQTNYRYPSFKIRLHDDVINPSGKDYLWNARPWPKHEKTAPENYFSSSQKQRYGSGFARLNEFLRQKQRDAQFSSSLAEHTRLWGNRFSQGYYGRVLDEQSHAPDMSSYLGLSRDLASYKSAEPKSRSFLGFKRPALEKSAASQQSTQQKDADNETEKRMAYSTPMGLPTEVSVSQVDPSALIGNNGRPEEPLLKKIETSKSVETNSLPNYSMIPPGPTGVPATDDFKCPGLFGYYTDPDNCSSFFMCSWGVSYRLQCSEGTLWNTVDSVCDWAANVSCDQRKLS